MIRQTSSWCSQETWDGRSPSAGIFSYYRGREERLFLDPASSWALLHPLTSVFLWVQWGKGPDPPKFVNSSDRPSTFTTRTFRSKDKEAVGQREDPVVTAVLRRGRGRTQAAWDGDDSPFGSIAHGNLEPRKACTSDELQNHQGHLLKCGFLGSAPGGLGWQIWGRRNRSVHFFPDHFCFFFKKILLKYSRVTVLCFTCTYRNSVIHVHIFTLFQTLFSCGLLHLLYFK